ncbi:MAG: hypothetical protein WEF50_08920 [Myxococcota bacterium]
MRFTVLGLIALEASLFGWLAPAPAHAFDFGIDENSPEAPVPFSPADVIFQVGNGTLHPASRLGLDPGDNADALSYGRDLLRPAGPNNFVSARFSVNRSTQGVGAGVIAQQRLGDGAAGDEFDLLLLRNGRVVGPYLVSNSDRHNLQPTTLGTESDLDSLAWPPSTNAEIFYSVDRATATARALDPAAIYLVPAPGQSAQLFASAAQLGLLAGDNVDALALRSGAGPRFALDASDLVWVSLDAASPTRVALGGNEAVLQIFPGPIAVTLNAAALGLLPGTGEELNALAAFDPGPEAPPDSASAPVRRRTPSQDSRRQLGWTGKPISVQRVGDAFQAKDLEYTGLPLPTLPTPPGGPASPGTGDALGESNASIIVQHGDPIAGTTQTVDFLSSPALRIRGAASTYRAGYWVAYSGLSALGGNLLFVPDEDNVAGPSLASVAGGAPLSELGGAATSEEIRCIGYDATTSVGVGCLDATGVMHDFPLVAPGEATPFGEASNVSGVAVTNAFLNPQPGAFDAFVSHHVPPNAAVLRWWEIRPDAAGQLALTERDPLIAPSAIGPDGTPFNALGFSPEAADRAVCTRFATQGGRRGIGCLTQGEFKIIADNTDDAPRSVGNFIDFGDQTGVSQGGVAFVALDSAFVWGAYAVLPDHAPQLVLRASEGLDGDVIFSMLLERNAMHGAFLAINLELQTAGEGNIVSRVPRPFDPPPDPSLVFANVEITSLATTANEVGSAFAAEIGLPPFLAAWNPTAATLTIGSDQLESFTNLLANPSGISVVPSSCSPLVGQFNLPTLDLETFGSCTIQGAINGAFTTDARTAPGPWSTHLGQIPGATPGDFNGLFCSDAYQPFGLCNLQAGTPYDPASGLADARGPTAFGTTIVPTVTGDVFISDAGSACPDFDGDASCDPVDVCPFEASNRCGCGDVDDDGVLDAQDLAEQRLRLAHLPNNAVRADTYGSMGETRVDPTISSWVRAARAVSGLTPAAQDCPAALGLRF